MVASLKDVISRSTQAFHESPSTDTADGFTKWVLEWPAQAMVTARMINWTAEAIHSIQSGSLKSFLQRWNQQLEAIVALVRQGIY